MKVCLINPPRLVAKESVSLRSTPPLGLAYIAGALDKAGYEVQVIDCIAEAPEQVIDFNKEMEVLQHGLTFEEIKSKVDGDVSVIGISCMFTNNWLSNRKLIDYLGKELQDVSIIIGGEHATAEPEFCLKQTDFLKACVIGEGEDTIIDLVKAFSNKEFSGLNEISGLVYKSDLGEIVETGKRQRVPEIESIARPLWDVFPLKTYLSKGFSYGVELGKTLPIMASRGCPYSCTFCSSPQMWGTKYSMRSPDDVIDEIVELKSKYGITNFDFYDLTAIIKKQWIVEFSQKLMDSNLNITWQIPAGTRSEVIDQEVARNLYQSGCRNITYAPESGSKEVLKLIKKKVKIDRMLDSIRGSYREGLNVKLNMIIGFPGETHKHIFQTFWFLVRCSWNGAHDTIPSIFSPYPGSKLYEELTEKGVISLEEEKYHYDIIFGDTYTKNPVYNENMSASTVRFYAFLGFLIFYSSNYLFRPQRLLRTLRNVITKNYESRAEMTLGEMLSRRRIQNKKTTHLSEKAVTI